MGGYSERCRHWCSACFTPPCAPPRLLYPRAGRLHRGVAGEGSRSGQRVRACVGPAQVRKGCEKRGAGAGLKRGRGDKVGTPNACIVFFLHLAGARDPITNIRMSTQRPIDVSIPFHGCPAKGGLWAGAGVAEKGSASRAVRCHAGQCCNRAEKETVVHVCVAPKRSVCVPLSSTHTHACACAQDLGRRNGGTSPCHWFQIIHGSNGHP